LFNAFVVTPIRLLLWLIFIGSAPEFLLKGMGENWQMQRIQNDLHNYFIVVRHGEIMPLAPATGAI
jgi:voltage-gated potassium channel